MRSVEGFSSAATMMIWCDRLSDSSSNSLLKRCLKAPPRLPPSESFRRSVRGDQQLNHPRMKRNPEPARDDYV